MCATQDNYLHNFLIIRSPLFLIFISSASLKFFVMCKLESVINCVAKMYAIIVCKFVRNFNGSYRREALGMLEDCGNQAFNCF